MATNVIINNNQPQPQPQPQAPTLIAVHSNQWSTGICDCFDDLGVCCFAYWCFTCFACNTASEFGECFCLPLVDVLWNLLQTATCFPVCVPPIGMSMRAAVRNRYGIQGDITGDCVNATLLSSCSWCQMAREIKRRTQTLTVVAAQPPVFAGPQQYMMATQPAVVTSQPVISAAPQGLVAARVM